MSAEQIGFRRRLPALLAAVGVLLSGALERVHFLAHTSPSATSFCTAGPRFDCSTVALSRWSIALGIPVPIWGIAGFLALTFLAWWRSRLLLPLSIAAAAASAVLLGVELASIRSVCLLCEGVHVTSFVLAFVAWRNRASLIDVDEMTHVHLFTVPVGILVSARVLMTPYWAVFSWQGGVRLPHGQEASGSQWIGAESPKVVVDEYTDYSCAHCAAVTKLVRRLLVEHPSSLRVVHHNYPRMRCYSTSGPLSCQYARAVNCAGDQGKFWEADSWLFEHAPGKVTIDFGAMAPDLGLDANKLSSCMASQASYDRADGEALAASHKNVIDAPSYFIDGKKFIGGSVLPEISKRL